MRRLRRHARAVGTHRNALVTLVSGEICLEARRVMSAGQGRPHSNGTTIGSPAEEGRIKPGWSFDVLVIQKCRGMEVELEFDAPTGLILQLTVPMRGIYYFPFGGNQS